MQEDLKLLVDLQKTDSRIGQIESVVTDIPLQTKGIQEKLSKATAGREAIVAEISENKKAYATLENELNEKKDLLASSQTKLTSVQNNKEYESVLRELETLKKNITDGDEQLKEMTNSNFKYESELATIKELEDGLNSQLDEINSSKVNEDKDLNDELVKLKVERDEIAATIKKSLLMKYERVRAHRNNIGIALVKDEVCHACYMHIPPQLYVDVKKDKAIYACPHCQRILYYVNKEQQTEGAE